MSSYYDEEYDFNKTCEEGENCVYYLDPDSKISVIGWQHIIALVCYAIVFLLGVPGNGLVVWVTAFRMPRSVNALWFLNLAVADLLCCLSLPFQMAPLAHDKHWVFGAVACKLLNGLFNMLMYCSVLLLVLISLDRWLLVSRPTWCQNWRTPRYATGVCIAGWLLALVSSIPQFVFMDLVYEGSNKVKCMADHSVGQAWGMTIFRLLAGFLLPFMIISISHLMVYRRAGQSPGQRQNKRSARTIRIILAVVLSFFLCWLPLHIVEFAILVTQKDTAHLSLAEVLALCLAYFNSCLNPLLYVCMGRGFRESLTKSLRSILHFASDEPPRGVSLTASTRSTADKSVMGLRVH
ncbi:C5a anaphylatoxin chemotactic receptor 1 [Hoplias malabaricus]|uniref:C5a anaphylatoxin chemotactic receptor 1 n=1 Tax=Hoplias malabaricus TaxID=27720 RepID=UPI00346333AD